MADEDVRAELLIATVLPAMLAGVAVLARRKQRAAREMAATLATAESQAKAAVAATVADTRIGLAEDLQDEVTARVGRLTRLAAQADAAVTRRDADAATHALEVAAGSARR